MSNDFHLAFAICQSAFEGLFRRQQREPMLLFQFAGPLFRFNAKTPAFEPLFQLPPRSAEAGKTAAL